MKFVQLRDRKAMLADEEVVPVFGLGNHFDYQTSGLLCGLIINLLYIKVILFDLIIGHFSGPSKGPENLLLKVEDKENDSNTIPNMLFFLLGLLRVAASFASPALLETPPF